MYITYIYEVLSSIIMMTIEDGLDSFLILPESSGTNRYVCLFPLSFAFLITCILCRGFDLWYQSKALFVMYYLFCIVPDVSGNNKEKFPQRMCCY